MGVPFFELKELIGKNDLNVFSSNYTLVLIKCIRRLL
ncbi:hypothetical protein FH603_939 [Spirosoma sp. LMG 31447]|uniref:Uncharacterized protein n=1 Tax=Spirosoma utsteinense TaxID=2585773 RepID=A0ABR6W413_9BACT|nr:hypothetical protein [Spirosoma utsteinense]